MTTRPIALTTKNGPTRIPAGTVLTLQGTGLQATGDSPETGPEPAHPRIVSLTEKSVYRIANHPHQGPWTLSGSHGSVILLTPNNPEQQVLDSTEKAALPAPPGILMERPAWTTFVKDKMIDYYDGPRAFLKRDHNGQDYLVLWHDEAGTMTRWLHLPLNPSDLAKVLTGQTPIKEAIEQSDFIFLMDEDPTGTPVRTAMTVPSTVPKHHPTAQALPSQTATMQVDQTTLDDWYRA